MFERKYFILRENSHSLMAGAISEDSFVRGEKRSLISLQMCFMGCIYEILAVVAALLSALLGSQIQEFNIPNIHFPDVILMFVVIPFIHLLNDEDTKGIIFDQGWIQGIKYVLGINKDCDVNENVANSGEAQSPRRYRNLPPRAFSPMITKLTTSQRLLIFRKCKSSINMLSKDTILLEKEKMHLERRYSLTQDVFPGLIKNEKKSELQDTMARHVAIKKAENEIQRNIPIQRCHSSLRIIYIDD